MKKIILSLFLSIIWFIGFSSAVNVSCTYDSEWQWLWWWLRDWWNVWVWEDSLSCDPSWIDTIYLDKFTISFDFDWQEFNGYLEDNLSIYLTNWKDENLILYCDWEESECYNYDVVVDTYEDLNSYFSRYWDLITYRVDYSWLWSFDIDFSYTITDNEENNDEPDEPDEPWTWWNENPPVIPDNPWNWWNWWNIVPDWSIVSVIAWVFSVFAELIPYIIYLWIWLLIVTVWFYAIRWLVNWISDKINNNFKF